MLNQRSPAFYLKRVARMSAHEIYTRTRQALAKRTDLALASLHIQPGTVAGTRAGVSAGRFFFDAHDAARLTGVLRERFPEQAERILDEAERVCRGRFNLLGYEDLRFGEPPDWHLDAVHGKRAPRSAWFHIPFLDFDSVGDHKVIWELNRHQFLPGLAKAYRITGERRFLARITELWYDWQRHNPYPWGVNWASSLEVAFRALAWLWTQALLEGCPEVPEQFPRNMTRALASSGSYIERFLSTYFAPNTHLLGEGVALFFIGVLRPELPAAARWRRRGFEIVIRECERQVRTDGMHFEQSTYYHVYALDFFLHARILAARNSIAIPPVLDETLKRMLDALAVLSQAGPPPRFGDDDGGRLFDARRNRPEHMTDPLATGAALFGSAEYAYAARGPREETLWLLGEEGLRRLDALQPVPAPARPVILPQTGIYGMTTCSPATQLFIDAGPQGFGASGHGHADALSVQLSAEGRAWLIDPGAFCYASPNGSRDRYRGTAAHNTMRVDGLDQAEATGMFSWSGLPETRVERWVTGETFDLFEGTHSGYLRLPQPVLHRRCVFGLKGNFWLIRDAAEGEGRHSLDIFWHLAPGLQLALLGAAGSGWQAAVETGAWSPAYGREEPAPVLRYGTEAELPAETAVLLLSSSATAETGAFTAVPGTAGSIAGAYRYDTACERHWFFFASAPRPWTSGEWSSDAAFVYCRVRPSGIAQLVLCDGSYLDFRGRRILDCGGRIGRFEMDASGGAAHTWSSGEVTVRGFSPGAFSAESC